MGRTLSALTGLRLLLERFLHLFDRGFAAFFLRGLLILAALVGRDLADQAEIAALKLARCELLRRQCRAAAALLTAATTGRSFATARNVLASGRTAATASRLRAACRGRSARGLCAGAARASGRTSRRASRPAA